MTTPPDGPDNDESAAPDGLPAYPGPDTPAPPEPGTAGTTPHAPYAAAPYPVAPYPGGIDPGAPRPLDALAVTSLVCGVAAIPMLCVYLGPLVSIAAIVTGHLARRRIRTSGDRGDGLAVAGLILGYVGLVLMIATLAYVIVAFSQY